MLEHEVPPTSGPTWPRVDFERSVPIVGSFAALGVMLLGVAAFFRSAFDRLDEPLKPVLHTAILYAALFWLSALWLFVAAMAVILRGHRWPSRVLAAALIPLPVAVITLGFLYSDDSILARRFDASRDQLAFVVDRFEAGLFEPPYKAGTFEVQDVYRVERCVFVETDYYNYEYAGFAYCTGNPPGRSNLEMTHLRDEWWSYYHLNSIK